jgi:hypothetical protein
MQSYGTITLFARIIMVVERRCVTHLASSLLRRALALPEHSKRSEHSYPTEDSDSLDALSSEDR